MIAKVKALGKMERPSLYHMNTSHLKDPTLVDKLKWMWEELLALVIEDESRATALFFKGLYNSKRITRTHGKLKAKLRRRKLDELQVVVANQPGKRPRFHGGPSETGGGGGRARGAPQPACCMDP